MLTFPHSYIFISRWRWPAGDGWRRASRAAGGRQWALGGGWQATGGRLAGGWGGVLFNSTGFWPSTSEAV